MGVHGLMSIASDMIAQFGETLTVKRRSAAGSFVSGRWVDAAESSFSAVMSVQPLGDKELLLLEEGQRTRRTLKGYTSALLKTGDKAAKTSPDRVLYDGAEFEVQRVEKWVDGDIGDVDHYKVYLAEVNT
jgi:hypothetical protein